MFKREGLLNGCEKAQRAIGAEEGRDSRLSFQGEPRATSESGLAKGHLLALSPWESSRHHSWPQTRTAATHLSRQVHTIYSHSTDALLCLLSSTSLRCALRSRNVVTCPYLWTTEPGDVILGFLCWDVSSQQAILSRCTLGTGIKLARGYYSVIPFPPASPSILCSLVMSCE